MDKWGMYSVFEEHIILISDSNNANIIIELVVSCRKSSKSNP